jgi:hypothetical protein
MGVRPVPWPCLPRILSSRVLAVTAKRTHTWGGCSCVIQRILAWKPKAHVVLYEWQATACVLHPAWHRIGCTKYHIRPSSAFQKLHVCRIAGHSETHGIYCSCSPAGGSVPAATGEVGICSIPPFAALCRVHWRLNVANSIVNIERTRVLRCPAAR